MKEEVKTRKSKIKKDLIIKLLQFVKDKDDSKESKKK